MKSSVLSLLMLLPVTFSLKAQDLPGATANLQTLSAGSYVIAMDNTLQTNTAGYFNLKAYGLVVYLLNNNVKLKWVIAAGKIKDGIDFSGSAEQFQPALIAGGILRNFKGGPFVIAATDTTGVSNLITAFYTANSLTGNNRPKVYRLTTSATTDIRYDMTGFKPKAAILTDGGNQSIHIAYMTNASIPSTNYANSTGSDLLTKCFTFASEPHNSVADDATIAGIKSFVSYGGNFLAECEAIQTYENSLSGHLQTTNGIHVTNTNVSTAAVIFPNADLSFSQIDGIFDINYGGSVRNWTLATGSSFANNEHNHASGGTISAQTPIGASVSKLNAIGQKGGLAFYLGNHNFASLTAIESINGIRMYLNAFLTPVTINSGCQTGTQNIPLAVKLINFQGNLNNDKVMLEWTIADNETAQEFDIEKSFDEKNFVTAGVLFADHKIGTEKYNFNDIMSTTGRMYFRLKMHDRSQAITYSQILAFQAIADVENEIRIATNPVNDKLSFNFQSFNNQQAEISVFDLNGHQRMTQTITMRVGSNFINLPLGSAFTTGVYILKLNTGAEMKGIKFVKL